jgi:hypothetical protein
MCCGPKQVQETGQEVSHEHSLPSSQDTVIVPHSAQVVFFLLLFGLSSLVFHEVYANLVSSRPFVPTVFAATVFS